MTAARPLQAAAPAPDPSGAELRARLTAALRADGWWLRSDIIWHKTACLPESVKDRPTASHEHVLLLAKSKRYFFDADAIAEPEAPSSAARYDYLSLIHISEPTRRS